MHQVFPSCICIDADTRLERWFKDGIDVNEVEIGEAHW